MEPSTVPRLKSTNRRTDTITENSDVALGFSVTPAEGRDRLAIALLLGNSYTSAWINWPVTWCVKPDRVSQCQIKSGVPQVADHQ